MEDKFLSSDIWFCMYFEFIFDIVAFYALGLISLWYLTGTAGGGAQGRGTSELRSSSSSGSDFLSPRRWSLSSPLLTVVDRVQPATVPLKIFHPVPWWLCRGRERCRPVSGWGVVIIGERGWICQGLMTSRHRGSWWLLVYVCVDDVRAAGTSVPVVR